MNKVLLKKIIYIILVILLFFNIILFINNFVDNDSSYIILKSDSIIKINKNNISMYRKNYKKLNYSSAKLYKNDEVIDGYIKVDDSAALGYTTVNFYKRSLETEDTNNSIIVVGDMKLKNYTDLISKSITKEDSKIISNYVKENSIGKINDLTQASVTNLNNRKIYTVRNYNFNEKDNNFSVIFLKENENYQLIYKSIGEKVLKRSSKLSKIIDLNNDNNADLILESAPFGTDVDFCYSVYVFDKSSNKYKPVINCEEE